MDVDCYNRFDTGNRDVKQFVDPVTELKTPYCPQVKKAAVACIP